MTRKNERVDNIFGGTIPGLVTRLYGPACVLLSLVPACRQTAQPARTATTDSRPVDARIATRVADANLDVRHTPRRPAASPGRDPVAALEGMDLKALGRLFAPGRSSSRWMKGIATFLDDEAGGRDDRIDAGLEALHLATYLLETGAALRRGPPGREDIARYRARTLPRSTGATKLASQLRYDIEGGNLTRRSHGARTARFWRPHFNKNKRRIMSAVKLMKRRRSPGPGRPLVMVLGAGSCADIPLREMVAAGCDVILVDLDLASLKEGIAMQLSPPRRRHVRLELRDLSGGVVDAISRAAGRIIGQRAAKKRSAAQVRAALNVLFRRQRASVPKLEGDHRVDLLVSSLLIGQLPVFPAQTIGRWFEGRFKEPLVSSRDDMLAQSEFGDRLFDAHIEALTDFVTRSRGVVYFSSDLYMMPALYEIRSGKMRYGHKRPVMGYRGQPLIDLDLPFENNPALKVISPSARGVKGSDFWIWDQEPAQLTAEVSTVTMPSGKDVVRLVGKKGMARAVDAVILTSSTPAAGRKRR